MTLICPKLKLFLNYNEQQTKPNLVVEFQRISLPGLNRTTQRDRKKVSQHPRD